MYYIHYLEGFKTSKVDFNEFIKNDKNNVDLLKKILIISKKYNITENEILNIYKGNENQYFDSIMTLYNRKKWFFKKYVIVYLPDNEELKELYKKRNSDNVIKEITDNIYFCYGL